MGEHYRPIMRRIEFERFVLTLQGATLVRQWRNDSVAKVGGKIFALLDDDPGELCFKASDMAFDLLCDLDGIRPAPYFARARWVAVSEASPLGDDEIRAYIIEAHRLIATKLTRKLRADLDLEDLIAAAPQRP